MKMLFKKLPDFKNFSRKEHLWMGLFTWVSVFIIITGFSFTSHPEGAAPYTYFVAVVIGLIFLIKASRKKFLWPNFIVFAIVVLMMLDESAYGTEVFGWDRFYWERHNLEIWDLHNFLTALPVIIRIELESAEWGFAMLPGYWKTNQIIAGLLFLYLVILRLFASKKSEDNRRGFSFDLGILILILFTFGTIYQLFSIPKDPKNIWIFGLSKSRLVLIGAVILFVVSQLIIYFNFRQTKSKIIRFITQVINSQRRSGWIGFILGFALMATIAYQFVIPFRPFPDYKAVFTRITPIVFLGEILVGLLILVLLSWKGIFTQSMSTYWKWAGDFLDRYPAYIYLGYGILQIFIALLVDRGHLNIDSIIPAQELLGINSWSVWMEESFEMVASFEFMLAGLTFYFKRNVIVEDAS